MKLKLAVALIVSLLCFGVASAAVETDWSGLNPNIDQGTTSGGILIVPPTASVSAGTYHSSQSVVLTAAGSNSIRYATDGTDPTCSAGSVYSSALTINATTTLKAIACYESDNSHSSTVSTYAYTFTCSTSSVSNGTVGAYPTCSISCNSGYTLSGSTCVASSSGGGGGGGGGGGYPAPVVTTTTTTTTSTAATVIPGLSLPYANPATAEQISSNRQALITYIVTLLQKLNPTAATPGSETITQNLSYGSTGDQVKVLQQFLKNQGAEIYPEQLVTGYFGNATRSAVGRFQIKYGIVAGSSDGGYGVVGPKTRTKINEFLGK